MPDGERGGHLVLVTGMATDAHGEIRTVIVHNPNARTRRTQEAYAAPIERFTEAFAGRGLVLWRSAEADAPLAVAASRSRVGQRPAATGGFDVT